MKLDAVAVSTTDMAATIKFYGLLGFGFPSVEKDMQHIESTSSPNGVRLMIDHHKMLTEILGYTPQAGNHSCFAILYEKSKEVNDVALKLQQAGFELVKEPWDAFWGQRYCVVKDPDGYMSDLFAPL